MLQVLVEGAVGLLAAVSVKSSFDFVVLIDFVDDCVGVGFVARSVDVDFEYGGDR